MVSSSAFYFKFYEPIANPTGLSGEVGGWISSTELQPKLGYLFVDIATPELSTQRQFRKVWIKQEGLGTFEDVSLNIVNIEHTGQIDFVTGSPLSTDFASSPLDYPTGDYGALVDANFSGNVDSAMYIGGTTQNDLVPVWIRQTIATGDGTDVLSSFSFQVKGTKVT